MPTQLAIYNGALRLCRDRRLSSLTESREPRRLLDDAWSDGRTEGSVNRCLELGQWAFATRTIELYASPSVEPAFGYRYAFDQPEDMVDICGMFTDEYTTRPLLRYHDESKFWYADIDPIYVSYVSNHTSYGADLSRWPQTFADLVEADLARQICGSITGADSAKVEREYDRRLTLAKSGDAMRKPTKFMPPGSWNLARQSRWGGDRTPTRRLIG